MRIEYYYKEGVEGCCPVMFYALIFNQQHQALKNNGSGDYALAAYASADHADFAIVLNEHTERTRFYYLDFDPANFTLAANVLGQPYTMEIWKALVGGTYSRTDDTLREAREFFWDGDNFINAEFSQSQINAIANQTSHVAAVYDSNNNVLRCMAFLDRNGSLITNPLSCNFRLISRANDELANSTITAQLGQQPGIFHWEQPGITLDPDEVYAVVALIIDADGNEHESASVQLTWD